jgi:hypothetical protein
MMELFLFSTVAAKDLVHTFLSYGLGYLSVGSFCFQSFPHISHTWTNPQLQEFYFVYKVQISFIV